MPRMDYRTDNEVQAEKVVELSTIPKTDNTLENDRTANKRFGARGAVVPQKILYEIERLSPAGNLV